MLSGTRIHWFGEIPREQLEEGFEQDRNHGDVDAHLHWSTFISKELPEIHKRLTFITRDDPVGTFDSEYFQTAEWPVFEIDVEENELPTGLSNIISNEVGNENVPAVADDLLTYVYGGLSNQNISRTYLAANTSAKAAIKSVQDHADDERHTRQASGSLSMNAGNAEYSGPLYAYEVDDRNDQGNITSLERKSPINAIWDDVLANSASWVVSQMVSQTWMQSRWLGVSYDRYVIIRDRNQGTITTRVQDDEVDDRRTIAGLALPEGYHLRAFEIGNMDNHVDVVGQLHWDPPAHGHVTDDMRFAHSRRRCANDWRTWGQMIETTHVGNAYKSHGNWSDDFMSAGGSIGKVS